IQRGKPELPGLPATYAEQDEEACTLELYLEDPVAGMELVLLYTIYEELPVLARSARFICRGPETVCLERAMS
ncbi:glycoside hydrolase family 36 N-terminal domain-containing protein, partial [Eggerthella lenta]|uniref:glycoside hydrolase family 36 N-terminal domain-containing protein n=2 Tax=Bacillati TaxID=1783272 RepID=UPI001D06CB12